MTQMLRTSAWLLGLAAATCLGAGRVSAQVEHPVKLAARIESVIVSGALSTARGRAEYVTAATEVFSRYVNPRSITRSRCFELVREVVAESYNLFEMFETSGVPEETRRLIRLEATAPLMQIACREDLPWNASTPAANASPASSDVQIADGHIRWALGAGRCSRAGPCTTWARIIQVRGIPVVIARNWIPAGDMIIRAKAARIVKEDLLARTLVASTQAHNDEVREWLDAHPDAVLAALDALPVAEVRSRADALTILRSVFPLLTIP